jgi:TRAP-type C4-dicarboxylate transport system substrate-binding protein
MLTAVGVAVALGVFSLNATAAHRWDLASVLPPGNFQVQSATRFADAVRKATNGQVDITVHPGGALGLKGPDELKAVRDGAVTMADIQMNQQVGENPLWGIESLPYLATSYSDLRKLRQFTRPMFVRLAKKYNQKILYMIPWPPQGLFANVRLDNSTKQIQGIKIRTIDKNASNFFSKLGSVPFQMPWGEVVPALATGVINAVATSSTSAVDGKFWEYLKYWDRINWQMNSQMVTINLDAWKQLKPTEQQKIEAIAKRMEPEFWKASETEDKQNAKTLKSHGMKIVEPSSQLKSHLNKIGDAMWSVYAKKVGPEAAKILSKYRAAMGK